MSSICQAICEEGIRDRACAGQMERFSFALPSYRQRSLSMGGAWGGCSVGSGDRRGGVHLSLAGKKSKGWLPGPHISPDRGLGIINDLSR